MKTKFILLLLCLSGQVFSQEFLNLDFEYTIHGVQKPLKWFVGGEGYTATMDSEIKHNGSYSIKIESNNPTQNQFAVCTGTFPPELVKGKEIEFSGWIRTKNVEEGYAGLWWRVDGTKGTLGFDNMHDRGIKGTNEWEKVSIKMKIDEKVTNINFGGLFIGHGKAWFDNFEVLINGVKFNDVNPRTYEPTPKEIAWLRKNIYPLRTCEPGGSMKDLEILKTLIGNAHMVALGENTHGSGDIFKMKDRIIEYLRSTMGFNIFSIEANMPEAYKINDYVLRNTGDPVKLIKGMYFWTWSTTEVLNMVEWMNKYNASQDKISFNMVEQMKKYTAPQEKIIFSGFDMQTHQGSIRELRESFSDDAATVEIIGKLNDILERVSNWRRNSLISIISTEERKEVNEKLAYLRAKVTGSKKPADERIWLLQNIRIIEQSLDVSSRDKFMAENLMWIRRQNPESKIVVWAHNQHIQKTGPAMGKYLADSLKNDYLNIGFTFNKGSYTAGGLTTITAQESYPGTYEYFFNAIKVPIFILDLRNVKKENHADGEWLNGQLDFRTVGATNGPKEFYRTNLSSAFDLIIFIDETKASVLLK